MAGINDTDIFLDSNWQISQATGGDALLISDMDCFFQDIRLEAMTQEGELFYDESWGWSLLDFIQVQDDELTRAEIEQRVQLKLSRREEIAAETISAVASFVDDTISIHVTFRLEGDESEYQISIDLDRINLEVIVR